MIFWILISMLMSLATGYLIVSSIMFQQRTRAFDILFKISLSIGLGFGISSCSFFIYLLLFNNLGKGFMLIDIVFLAIASLFFVYKRRGRPCTFSCEVSSVTTLMPVMVKVISKLFVIMVIGILIALILKSIMTPHGYQDATAVYNMKARFLFRGGDQWINAFHIGMWTNPSYPILLPGAVARLWKYAGTNTTIVPIIVTMLFTFSTVGLLFSSLSFMRGKSQGVLAAFLLLGSTIFIQSGVNQMADVPVGFFYLSTIILLCLKEHLSTNYCPILILAGITAGFAAWTKNEGILFILSVLVANALLVIPIKGWKIYLNDIKYFIIGLMPILVIIIYFKSQLVPTSWLTDQGFHSMIEKITDLPRYFIVGKMFLWKVVVYNHCFLIFLPLYFVLLGWNNKRRESIAIKVTFLIFCIMLSGLFFVYILSPMDPIYQLSCSLPRILTQFLPGMIFVIFMIVNSPEESIESLRNIHGDCKA